MTSTDDLFISTTCNSNSTYYLPIICSLLILFPYIFKIISFFSPFFITITLVLICFIVHYQKPDFIQTIVDKLRPKVIEEEDDEEFRDFEESDIYKTVFDEPLLIMENSERKLERLFEELDRFEDSTAMPENTTTYPIPSGQGTREVECRQILPLLQDKPESKETASSEIPVSRQNQKTVNSTSSKNFSSPESVKSDLEACSSEAAKSKTSRIFRSLESIKSDLEKASAMATTATTTTTTTTTTNSAEDLKTNEKENSVTVKSIISRLESSTTFGSYRLTKLDLEEASSTAISTSGDDENTVKSSSNSCSPSFGSYDSPKSDPEETEDTKTVKSKSNSMRLELDSSSSSFGSYGSMRKEKEWKRTLACKLFEERRSLEGGGEGMDSLWEAYEEDNTNKKSSNSKKKTIVKNSKKAKNEFKYFDDGISEDGDEDDEFTGNAQLCCLKALKMSTGKMNLGMGKPNLVKFSKALKGFGWLHHKHAKKC